MKKFLQIAYFRVSSSMALSILLNYFCENGSPLIILFISIIISEIFCHIRDNSPRVIQNLIYYITNAITLPYVIHFVASDIFTHEKTARIAEAFQLFVNESAIFIHSEFWSLLILVVFLVVLIINVINLVRKLLHWLKKFFNQQK